MQLASLKTNQRDGELTTSFAKFFCARDRNAPRFSIARRCATRRHHAQASRPQRAARNARLATRAMRCADRARRFCFARMTGVSQSNRATSTVLPPRAPCAKEAVTTWQKIAPRDHKRTIVREARRRRDAEKSAPALAPPTRRDRSLDERLADDRRARTSPWHPMPVAAFRSGNSREFRRPSTLWKSGDFRYGSSRRSASPREAACPRPRARSGFAFGRIRPRWEAPPRCRRRPPPPRTAF